MSSNYENLDKVEEQMKEREKEEKKKVDDKKIDKKIDKKEGKKVDFKKADKKGDKKEGKGKKAVKEDAKDNKKAIEPFQVQFKMDTVTHYMIGLGVFWVTSMSATACSFFLYELLYPPSIDGTLNCIMHGLLVLFMHLTGLTLSIARASKKVNHWKYKFYIIFLISFLCAILTPLVSNSLEVFSVTLTIHCVIAGLSAFYIALVIAHAIWKPGQPSFFTNSKRTVLVEKRRKDGKTGGTTKSTVSTTGGTTTGGTTGGTTTTGGKSTISTGTTGGMSTIQSLDDGKSKTGSLPGGKSKTATATSKTSAVSKVSKSGAPKTK